MGRAHVPSQVSWASHPLSLRHCRSTTLQSCHSGPLHQTAGPRAHVAFGDLLVFPAGGPGDSSRGGRSPWATVPAAPPQSSARHTASEALLSQCMLHTGCQDVPSRTSTAPLQRLLPFTRRTRSGSPGSVRCKTGPLSVQLGLLR